MKILIITFVALLSFGKAFAEEVKEDRCAPYRDVPFNEAKTTLLEKSQKANSLGVKLEAFQKSGVPDTDPESAAVAIPLGRTLGEMYSMCNCNIKLSSTSDCKAFVKMMNETIYAKQK